MEKPNQEYQFSFQPLSSSNFGDFEYLFGEKSACEGCWCMYWRLQHKAFEAGKGEGNRLSIKALVDSGQVSGVIAYHDNEAIAWCTLGTREHFPRLVKSRTLKPIDDKKAWIVSCLYISRNWRRKGVLQALLSYLIDYCSAQGAKILEGYPCDSSYGKYPDAFAWTGIAKAYKAVGFVEVAYVSEKRPVMRYYL